jgi:predicted ATP-grasp superfamily ATP-dependent carboligase
MLMSDRPPLVPTGSGVAAILLTRDSGGAFAAARCLGAASMRFHLVATDACLAVRTMRGCTGATRVSRSSFENGDGVLRDVLCALLEANPGAVVVPSEMEPTAVLARIGPDLPPRQVFPLSSEPLLRELDDKWRFAGVVDGLGLVQPRTRLISTPADLDDLDMRFPAVIKPLVSEGSRGLRWVDTSAALAAAVARIAAADLLPVLVQEHIEGTNTAVSGLAERGVVRAFLVHQPMSDGSFEFAEAPDAVEVAKTLVSATNFHGVFNIDFQREAETDKLFVLEINPRLYASVHKDAYAGVNLVELGVRLARGEEFCVPAARREVVLQMTGRVRRLVASKGRAGLSPGSRTALRADLHDPLSTVVRALEWWIFPRRRRIRAAQVRPWARFDDEENRWRRRPSLR